MIEDDEITWHKNQIAKNQTILEELETGNTVNRLANLALTHF